MTFTDKYIILRSTGFYITPINSSSVALNNVKIFSKFQFCLSFFSLGICSIFTLSVLALERYNIICKPFTFGAHLTMKRATLYIIGTWATSAFVSVPPLFGWGSYQQEAANIR